ncbi:MAG: 50S ribosomal protein L4 [bacterium]
MEILTISGEVKRNLELPAEWFNRCGPKSLLWEAVRCHLANRRQGSVKTKTRGEVSGTGKKPWAQKHTGRARHGSRRSPLWRGGGIAWGPKPRDYGYELPKKARRLALALALTLRAKENNIKIVEEFELNESKTQELLKIINKIAMPTKNNEKVLLLVESSSENLLRASRNLLWLDVIPATQLNTYEVLTHQKLIFTEKGLERFLSLHRNGELND